MNIEEKIRDVARFYHTGATRDVDFRISVLEKLRTEIINRQELICEALWRDLHKSAYESFLTEISIVLQELKEHISHLKKWTNPRKVSTPLHLFPAKSRIIYEPYGTVLVIAPWNYPFQLLMAPLIGAVSAGNCVIAKPSPYTPHVAVVMEELIAAVFDPGHVLVILGGREINTVLLDQKYDYIFFTGGPAVGKVVMEAAARNLTPLTLELGGKSPCIVSETADIDIAAKRVAWGKFLNAGQTCIAPDYLFIHRKIKPLFLEKLAVHIERFYGVIPALSPDFARIINEKAFERLLLLMEQGDIIIGGQTNRADCYIAPTVIDHIRPEYPVMQEEIFGPVLPVMEYSDLNEPVTYINEHHKPLALYYFGCKKEAAEVIRRTTSGGVCINDTILHIANKNLPFGGVGNSGMGKYHGFASFETFSNCRSVLLASNRFDLPFRYPPYGSFSLLKKLMR